MTDSGASANIPAMMNRTVPAFLTALLLARAALALDPTQSIQETLARITATEKELADAEKAFDQRLAGLRSTNPLFAEKDAFESDKEYIARVAKSVPQVDQIRKQMLGDLQGRLERLRATMFETTQIGVTLNETDYDPNTEIWKMSVESTGLGATKESFEVKIERPKARLLRQNRDKIQATGFLAIDPGDRPALVKVSILEPTSSTAIEREFPLAWTSKEASVHGVAKFMDRKHDIAYGIRVDSGPDKFRTFSVGSRSDKTIDGFDADGAKVINSDTGLVLTSDTYESGNDPVYVYPSGSLDVSKGMTKIEGREDLRFRGVSLGGDRKFLGVVSEHRFDLLGLENGKAAWSLVPGTSVAAGDVSFSSDGGFVAFSGCNYVGEVVLNVAGLAEGQVVLARGGVWSERYESRYDRCSSRFVPDTHVLLTTVHDGAPALEAFDVDQRKVIWRAAGTVGLAISPNAQYVASGKQLLDAKTGAVLKELPWVLEDPHFSFDSRYLVASVDDHKRVIVVRNLAGLVPFSGNIGPDSGMPSKAGQSISAPPTESPKNAQ